MQAVTVSLTHQDLFRQRVCVKLTGAQEIIIKRNKSKFFAAARGEATDEESRWLHEGCAVFAFGPNR